MRLMLAAMALGMLSACASVPPNSLSAEQRASVKVSEVKVTFAGSFKVPNMTTRMRYFDKYKAEYPELVAADTESDETAKRGKLTKEYVSVALREEILEAFAKGPSGPRATAIALSVNSMQLTSTMTTLLVKANSVGADASFVDPKTAEKLGAYDNIVAFNGGPGGVVSVALEAATKGGPADDAAEAYARELFMRFNRAE
jgi:hypothetical protein